MSTKRLEALADGIFAIVMTLLVFEISVPSLGAAATNTDLWDMLRLQAPAVMSFVLSFAVLFTYWRAHHYLMGEYAKTLDMHLMNINGLFLLFVALVPYTSHVLAKYSTMQIAISIFALNVIFIGLSLWWMRKHIFFTDYIENNQVDEVALRHGTIRTLVPVVFGVIAIPLSFWNTYVALALLTLAVIFNLFHRSTMLTDWLFGYRK